MRDLILSSDEYTEQNGTTIVSYCWEDILGLPSLWRGIQEVHAGFTERDEEGRQTPKRYNLTTAQFHGDYLVALAHLESHSRGFPIDVALLDQIYDNLPLIRRRLAEEANERYGGKVFVFDKIKDRFIFKEANLDAFLKDMAAKGIPIDWQRTRDRQAEAGGRLPRGPGQRVSDLQATGLDTEHPAATEAHRPALVPQGRLHQGRDRCHSGP